MAEERKYAPDYVSAETLAYRLDCSRSTIDVYVKSGLLPKPIMLGNLVRWDFGVVRAWIEGRGLQVEAQDDFMRAIQGGKD